MAPQNSKVFTSIEEPIEFIAGDTLSIPYEVSKIGGGVVDLGMTGTVVTWMLAPYGTPDAVVLTKSSTDTSQIMISQGSPSQFFVLLYPEDTDELEKMYTYQIHIKTPLGALYKRMQGHIIIWPRIPS